NDDAFAVTKNYTQQALASIANQIYSYASNIQATINLLEQQFDSLECQTRYIGQKIQLNNEKRSRKEIGRLTKPKRLIAQPMIVYPERPKTRIQYKRDSIDFSTLDNVGVAYKIHQQHNDRSQTLDLRTMQPIKSATLRPSKSSNLSSIIHGSQQSSTGQSFVAQSSTEPKQISSSAIRPSTPPTTLNAGMFNSLARHSKDSYRSASGYHHLHHPTPLVIPPPQVPSNYISNKDL
ncbi:CRE-ABI-1 protein-like protein, partial [Euroglyphus maynei]